MDEEAKQLIEGLPETCPDRPPYPGVGWNNCVYTEMRNAQGWNTGPQDTKWVCIYLHDGGWLAFPASSAIGDIAPFAG